MPSAPVMYRTVCRSCEITFETHQRVRVYCQDSCRIVHLLMRKGWCLPCGVRHPDHMLYSRIEYDDIEGFLAEHEECRKSFGAEHAHQVCCQCRPCRAARGDDMTPKHRTPSQAKRSTSYQRHRPGVLERDGFVCQICKLPTDPNAHPSDETYPVLDHVFAGAWGGDEGIANLRTAHRWCNEQKSDDLDVNPRIPEFAAVRLTPALERAGLLQVKAPAQGQ